MTEKFIIIEDPGDGHKAILEATHIEGRKEIQLRTSDMDTQWIKPKELLASLVMNGDGVRISMPGTQYTDEVYQFFDWSQIEYMNMLYTIFNNSNMKHQGPAVLQVLRLADED